MKVLIASSSRSPWFESQDPAEHMKFAPYSVDAIGANMLKLGHQANWAGWPTTHNPFRLARRIDELKPDIVYTYGATTSLNPIFCRKFLCKHKNFKIIHGWDDEYGVVWDSIIGWPGRVFFSWMEKAIVTKSDNVVTLSRYLQQKGRKWGVECHFIPNGADPIDPERIKGEIKLTGRFNIVYTGDKAKWKRTDDVCRAMKKLPIEIKLYLTGRDEDYLKPYASENCIFLGYLSKEEQFNVMSQADAFVVTADQDCNAKLQEYLRWKKPILAYDGRPNLFFTNGHNALLAKDGDYAPLIERLSNDHALCHELANNAATDIPIYNWLEIAQQFIDYFASLTTPTASATNIAAPLTAASKPHASV